MSDASQSSKGPTTPESGEDLGHPRGTLVIVLLFGLLFGLGWFLMYLFVFLQRGSLQP